MIFVMKFEIDYKTFTNLVNMLVDMNKVAVCKGEISENIYYI